MKKILFLIAICLFSCSPRIKTVTEYKEIIKKDTLQISVYRDVIKQVKDTIYIEDVCDTITGRLRDFTHTFNSGTAKIKIKALNGGIKADIDIDSIVNERIKERESINTSTIDKKTEKTIVYKTPLWAWLIIGFLTLFILVLLQRR